ncbi:TSUP family transporter [Ferruginibacter lapsinanis]|uniref:sulfite exporter TauE/SafE family protein n=1 Tax=Ferruginibacter lapsinanis TaxID=563172 RepID=UPI001E65BC2C|nr:TSUP family transporter [Ferruginibacter lapsinanis]UEG49851.1 TSUP family transporter [Ferruginibacter lapsinanis]
MSYEIIILCIAAFAAGFIDSISGGGGLVQTPATLITLNQYPLATLLGTTKIPSIFGTTIASFQYAAKVKINWRLLAVMCTIALIAAYAGSKTVSIVNSAFMKPVFFCILIVVAVYTYTKKDFGTATTTSISEKKTFIYAAAFALVIGFYDGFIGPGAGSFLMLFFISIIGFDFLKASAHAKIVNIATNLGSIIFFSTNGHILYHFAIPMAICNFSGSLIGARMAILKGNQFIRIFFLIVIIGTIIRFGYDIFFTVIK